jgi:hypothetical protein
MPLKIPGSDVINSSGYTTAEYRRISGHIFAILIAGNGIFVIKIVKTGN